MGKKSLEELGPVEVRNCEVLVIGAVIAKLKLQ